MNLNHQHHLYLKIFRIGDFKVGQYRLEILFVLGLGFYITITKQEVQITVPFIAFCIGTTKHARGYNIFGVWKN